MMTPKPNATLYDQFLEKIGDSSVFLQMLDHVPDRLYFVKDRQSRMIWVSHASQERLSTPGNQDVIGKTDYEFFPKHVADSFVKDDRLVMESGKPLLDRVEVCFGTNRELVWSVTSKFPIVGRNGEVIGLIGLVRNQSKAQKNVSADVRVDLAIKYIEANHKRVMSANEIAKHAHLSPRQLLRLFRKVFGIGIHEFLIKTRVLAAGDALLLENSSIAETASDFGFCDQSAFTRQFRAIQGITPAQFRRKYRNAKSSSADELAD